VQFGRREPGAGEFFGVVVLALLQVPAAAFAVVGDGGAEVVAIAVEFEQLDGPAASSGHLGLIASGLKFLTTLGSPADGRDNDQGPSRVVSGKAL
jgi:hypothetical protein